MSKPATAKITRLTPEGSTLARANGAAMKLGDTVTDGEAVTLWTPDGSSGAVSLDTKVALVITSRQLPPVEPPPDPATADTPRVPARRPDRPDPVHARPLDVPPRIKPIS